MQLAGYLHYVLTFDRCNNRWLTSLQIKTVLSSGAARYF
jgi:hypothetical protein